MGFSTVIKTTPTAPVDFTVTAGDSEVTLEWSTPYSNGGLIITDYEYSYRESSSNSWGSWTSVGTDQSATVSDLTNGTEYEFCVYAENSVGSGSWAGPSRATPEAPAIVPDAPTNLSASRGDDRESTLTWDAPANTGSSVITDYEYRYATGYYPNHNTFTEWVSMKSEDTNYSETSTTYTVTGLVNETNHLFQVRAVNSTKNSRASRTVNAIPRPPTPVWSDIPAPYNLTVGDSFSLDLNSYVTGSPTITRDAGAIPAGLSLSNGILSGTVTRIESRSIRFTATNSRGTVYSEWVRINVQAP